MDLAVFGREIGNQVTVLLDDDLHSGDLGDQFP